MDPSAEPTPDPLLRLELDIARRADEIARESRLGSSLNLHCWLVAETEVLARDAVQGASR
jgi:hypothetical protein